MTLSDSSDCLFFDRGRQPEVVIWGCMHDFVSNHSNYSFGKTNLGLRPAVTDWTDPGLVRDQAAARFV